MGLLPTENNSNTKTPVIWKQGEPKEIHVNFSHCFCVTLASWRARAFARFLRKLKAPFRTF